VTMIGACFSQQETLNLLLRKRRWPSLCSFSHNHEKALGIVNMNATCKTPQHQQKCNEKGELLLNAFVVFHIAEKVLSFSSLSPAFVFCLILLSFLGIAK
jgi:hypothetical protein